MTLDEANDEILTVFQTAWNDTGYTAIYTDIPGSQPQTEDPWARATVRHALGGQSSLGNDVGTQMYTNTGTLTVQVFAPMGDGGTRARQLAQLLLQAYSKARGTVWYRNQRANEIGAAGAFTQINVLVDFTYDDLR